MAFLRKITNREGKIYLSCVESYRLNGKMKQRTIKNFGRLDLLKLEDSSPEATAKVWVEEYNNSKSEMIISKTLSTMQVRDNPFRNIGHYLLTSIYKHLDISKVIFNYSKNRRYKYDLDKILQLLVFMRIFEPASKSATVDRQRELFGDWNISQNDMDRALDHFPKIKQEIQLAMHKSISKNIGRTATLVFYDVTNYYFETDIQDDIRKRGPSKEHRPKPIVQMGLFMDSKGIPISYELFEGNCVDPKTYIPAIEQVKKQFGIERIVTVADKAMNSMNNVTDAYLKGDGWVFSSKFRGRRGAPKDLQNFALDEKGWKYNSDNSFASKSMIRQRKLANAEMVDEKVLVTWRRKYAVREKHKRLEVLKVAQKMTKSEIERQLLGKGIKKFLQATDPETGEKVSLRGLYGVNLEQIEFDEQFDGMNIIVTSEVNMKDEDILNAYGQLNKIEDCFRVTKTSLNTRPVYVWTKEHIEAHFLTCFIALVIMKLLHYKLGGEYSIGKIIEGVKSLRAREFGKGYYETEANEDACNSLAAFNVNFSAELQKLTSIKELKTLGF